MAVWGSAWFAPIYMIPFLSMLAAHWLLGLSDALLVMPGPGEREAQAFNFAMVATFYAGLGFVTHHLLAPDHRGLPWLIGQLFLLGTIVVIGFLAL